MKIKNLYKDDISVSKGAFKIPISGLIDKYRARFEVLDKSGRFSHRVFRVLPNRTLVHVLVPSETLDDFSYDVVIEFNSMASDLMNCDVTMFSNSPSFAYTCCYVFYNHGHEKDPPKLIAQLLKAKHRGAESLLVSGLEDLFPQQMLTEPPKVRNPAELTVPDKTIYMALMYLENHVGIAGIGRGQPITERGLKAQLRDFDRLMRERKRAERKQKERRATEERAIDAEFRGKERELDRRNGIGTMTTKKPMGSMRAKAMSATKPGQGVKRPMGPRTNRR